MTGYVDLLQIPQIVRNTDLSQIDFGVICGILLLNATVGWYQEKQAADVVLVALCLPTRALS